jgi:hypothetical protein
MEEENKLCSPYGDDDDNLFLNLQTSIYSNDSLEKVTESNNEEETNTSSATIRPPLEPDKLRMNATPLKADTNEIDKEFDMFTKERIVQKKTDTGFNVKNNLGTVAEEEKQESSTTLAGTAFSAVQFRQPSISQLNSVTVKNDFTKSVDLDQKSQSLNFNEISRKPKALDGESKKYTMPENKPFLRDRSASIGTLSLKTPITQLIGEQNRTMLFQVSLFIFVTSIRKKEIGSIIEIGKIE